MNKIVDQYEPVYIQGLWHHPLFKANQYEIMIYCHRPTVAIIHTIWGHSKRKRKLEIEDSRNTGGLGE